ncbi:Tn3 family transposase [Streptomyces sp. NPDC059567]|uniref:Tn3 family transposase n=1 Tax=Streptomyces sp. NPDC059567 TaxID=3346867 RepID=UPI0036B76DA1
MVKYANALRLGAAVAEQVLRRFTRGGPQVVENWNPANTVLHYGKDGALTGPDKEHAETSMLALRLLQSALVHVNTLLVRQVLAEPERAKKAQRRGPARPDRAVLVQRQPVRHLPPGHGQAPGPGARCCRAPAPHTGGHRRPISGHDPDAPEARYGMILVPRRLARTRCLA